MSARLGIPDGTFLTLELYWGVGGSSSWLKTECLGTDLQSVSAPSLGQVGSTLAWTCVW